MSGTLPGADVRGFYRALGIELPQGARREAPVGCFADPDAHAHGDRDPSCSVNLETGAWHCWGCGATGGAYDAALARGRHPREAIDLMIAHGLATRRAGPPKRAGASAHPLLPPPRLAMIGLLTTSRAHRDHVSWRSVSRSWRWRASG